MRAAHHRATILLAAACQLVALHEGVASACASALQGEGRVAEIIDGRTFRMSDGGEVRLAGIEPHAGNATATDDLASLLMDRDVILHGDSDAPDRYGHQQAIVFLNIADPPVQVRLLAQGSALNAGDVADKSCAAELAAAEDSARRARRGIWAQINVIKNAESPGDILADVGRFVVVEGRVVSVRQAGTTTYVNFGRRWTQDFAVTISRRMMGAFARSGIDPKLFERRRIRVRGWVERRGGPRIEAVRVGQIEVVGDK